MHHRSLHPACSFALQLVLSIACTVSLSAQDADSAAGRHFLAARAAQSSGSFDLAVQEYLAVIRLEPNLAEARVNLGLVYYLQARYDESARTLEKSLALKPGMRGVDLFLGIDYVRLGEARRAIPFLKQAVSREPANKEARTWLGTALWDAGQENEAIAGLRDAARAFPSDPDVLFLLGQTYQKLGQAEQANRQFELAKSLLAEGKNAQQFRLSETLK